MAGKSLDSLDANARDLLLTSMTWMDHFWDEQAGLLWSPGDMPDPELYTHGNAHTVRDSSWYALGLLLRDSPGDRERTARVLGAVLDNQFDAPDRVYHGTFRRSPEEAQPPAPPVEWKDYDPNWREFIMTTIAVILDEWEDRLPPSVIGRIDAAIPKAVAGALARGLRAGYTNISLMNAFMMCFAGWRLGQPEWIKSGEVMGREIYRLFKQHETFEEYNSPTYYGVDLFALALWRGYSQSQLLRDMGKDMEAALWTDIGRYYHAGLRNIAGPYDRSYGMDMRRYAAVVAEWIWLVTGKERAPFPDIGSRFAHAHDFCFAPLPAVVGTQVPVLARYQLQSFQGERQVERTIADAPRRVVTAWLSDDIMLGAELSSGSKRGGPQFHPATVHWKASASEVGWMRLRHSDPVDARATAGQLNIAGTGELIFEIAAPGIAASAISADLWKLPGLTVHVETSVADVRVASVGDHIEVHYMADAMMPETVTLTMETQQE